MKKSKVIKADFSNINDLNYIAYLDITECISNDSQFDYNIEELGLLTDELIKHYIQHLQSFEWAFGRCKPDFSVVEVEKPGESIECPEFWGLYFYPDLACFKAELFDTPYDNIPIDYVFSTQFAFDCFYGREYSKDFSYFFCPVCERDICEQNPSNGWHVQTRTIHDELICTRCFDEEIISNGLDVDDILESRELPGNFFTDDELTSAGYKVLEPFYHYTIGSGYAGYKNPDDFFDELEKMRNKLLDKKLVISYDSMAIGGMGGYITVYVK